MAHGTGTGGLTCRRASHPQVSCGGHTLAVPSPHLLGSTGQHTTLDNYYQHAGGASTNCSVAAVTAAGLRKVRVSTIMGLLVAANIKSRAITLRGEA